MAIPPGWSPISSSDGSSVQSALNRLTGTFALGQYTNLNAPILQNKMQVVDSNTSLVFLRVFSRGSLASPDISAFFFLRRLYGPLAYCLTVGADPGVATATLQSELEAICGHMRTLAGQAQLDVMHERDTPNFSDPKSNLAQVYNMSKQSTQPDPSKPSIPPKLLFDSFMQMHYPWPEAILAVYVINLS
jgi:hypothetical protein